MVLKIELEEGLSLCDGLRLWRRRADGVDVESPPVDTTVDTYGDTTANTSGPLWEGPDSQVGGHQSKWWLDTSTHFGPLPRSPTPLVPLKPPRRSTCPQVIVTYTTPFPPKTLHRLNFRL